MLRALFALIALPLLLIVVLFVVANAQIVPVRLFPVFEGEEPLWLIGGALALAGFLAGALVAASSGAGRARRARAYRRQAEGLERESADLKHALRRAEERIEALEADRLRPREPTAVLPPALLPPGR